MHVRIILLVAVCAAPSDGEIVRAIAVKRRRVECDETVAVMWSALFDCVWHSHIISDASAKHENGGLAAFCSFRCASCVQWVFCGWEERNRRRDVAQNLHKHRNNWKFRQKTTRKNRENFSVYFISNEFVLFLFSSSLFCAVISLCFVSSCSRRVSQSVETMKDLKKWRLWIKLIFFCGKMCVSFWSMHFGAFSPIWNSRRGFLFL